MNIVKAIIWGQAILTLGIMAWLISLLGAEKRRVQTLLKDAIQISDKTGFPQSPLIDPNGLIEYLERHGFQNPNHHEDEFTITADEELNNFLNLSVDLVRGKGNMDLGLMWLDCLDSILDRLNPQNAPHSSGESARRQSEITQIERLKAMPGTEVMSLAERVNLDWPIHLCDICSVDEADLKFAELAKLLHDSGIDDERKVLGYVEGKRVYKGDKLYVDIRNTCATEWGEPQIVESSGNDGQGNMIIFEGGDYRPAKTLVWEPK